MCANNGASLPGMVRKMNGNLFAQRAINDSTWGGAGVT